MVQDSLFLFEQFQVGFMASFFFFDLETCQRKNQTSTVEVPAYFFVAHTLSPPLLRGRGGHLMLAVQSHSDKEERQRESNIFFAKCKALLKEEKVVSRQTSLLLLPPPPPPPSHVLTSPAARLSPPLVSLKLYF